jgi:hypothetical protein
MQVMAHPLSARSSPQSKRSPREQASHEGKSLTTVSHRKPNARAHAEGAVAALHLDSAAMHQPAATAAAAAAASPPPLTAAHVLGHVHNQTMRHATIDRETSFVDGVPFAKHLSVDGEATYPLCVRACVLERPHARAGSESVAVGSRRLGGFGEEGGERVVGVSGATRRALRVRMGCKMGARSRVAAVCGAGAVHARERPLRHGAVR